MGLFKKGFLGMLCEEKNALSVLGKNLSYKGFKDILLQEISSMLSIWCGLANAVRKYVFSNTYKLQII